MWIVQFEPCGSLVGPFNDKNEADIWASNQPQREEYELVLLLTPEDWVRLA